MEILAALEHLILALAAFLATQVDKVLGPLFGSLNYDSFMRSLALAYVVGVLLAT